MIFKAIRYALSEWKQKWKLRFFKSKWRKKNKHNYTNAGNLFPYDKVIVGTASYGTLNVVSYGNCDEQLTIGNYCSIAGNTTFILSGNHEYKCLSTYPFNKALFRGDVECKTKGPIIVDDDVWIGYGCIILSGVHICQGCIIAAGSVVTKNTEPYGVYGGVPAKLIKKRFDDSVIEQLIKIDFSTITPSFIQKNIEKFYSEIAKKEDVEWIESNTFRH